MDYFRPSDKDIVKVCNSNAFVIQIPTVFVLYDIELVIQAVKLRLYRI